MHPQPWGSVWWYRRVGRVAVNPRSDRAEFNRGGREMDERHQCNEVLDLGRGIQAACSWFWGCTAFGGCLRWMDEGR